MESTIDSFILQTARQRWQQAEKVGNKRKYDKEEKKVFEWKVAFFKIVVGEYLKRRKEANSKWKQRFLEFGGVWLKKVKCNKRKNYCYYWVCCYLYILCFS